MGVNSVACVTSSKQQSTHTIHIHMQYSAKHYKQHDSVVSCKQIIEAYGVHIANM